MSRAWVRSQTRRRPEKPGLSPTHSAGPVPCPGGRVHCPVPAGPGGAHHHPSAQGALLLLSQEILVLQLRADLCTQWPYLPLPRLPVDGRLRDAGTPGSYRQALITPSHAIHLVPCSGQATSAWPLWTPHVSQVPAPQGFPGMPATLTHYSRSSLLCWAQLGLHPEEWKCMGHGMTLRVSGSQVLAGDKRALCYLYCPLLDSHGLPGHSEKTTCYSGYRPQDSDRMSYLFQIACPATPKRLPVIPAEFCYYFRIPCCANWMPQHTNCCLVFH